VADTDTVVYWTPLTEYEVVVSSPVKSVPVTTTVQAIKSVSKTASALSMVGIIEVKMKSQVAPSQIASSDVFKNTTTSAAELSVALVESESILQVISSAPVV
jgi:hypothetical protein